MKKILIGLLLATLILVHDVSRRNSKENEKYEKMKDMKGKMIVTRISWRRASHRDEILVQKAE